MGAGRADLRCVEGHVRALNYVHAHWSEFDVLRVTGRIQVTNVPVYTLAETSAVFLFSPDVSRTVKPHVARFPIIFDIDASMQIYGKHLLLRFVRTPVSFTVSGR